MEITLLPTNISKNTSVCGTTPTEHLMLAEDLKPPKKASCSPHNGGRAKEIRKKRDKSIRMGPAPLGGSCEGGKFFSHFQKSSHWWQKG